MTKHREILVYLVVGVATTIVSWVSCFGAKFILDSTDTFQNFVINTIGWVTGVLFSYPLSRKWVFKSKNPHIFKEFAGFAGSRLSTWIMDILIMWLFVNVWPMYGLINGVLGWFGKELQGAALETANYWVAKICISAVIVTIANYIFSKVLVFKKKDAKSVNEQEESRGPVENE